MVNELIRIEVGLDVSDLLGIVKYEPPVSAQLAGISLGAFPSQVPKTDEERIQNLTREWPMLRTYTYEVTEKLEGSSMTCGIIDGEFKVCSRNLNLKEVEGNTFWKLAREYAIEENMRALGFEGIILQGELIGEGVQENHYGIKGHDLYMFKAYSIKNGSFLEPNIRAGVVQALGLKHVPVLGIFDMQVIAAGLGLDEIQNVLAYADGQSVLNPKVLREGVVFNRVDGQEHFKAVSNKYLILHG